jgi:hypothetical protein
VRLFPATKKKRRLYSMKEKEYVEDREDRIYEGICKAERAFAMTTIVLDFGFDDPELTADQIDTLKVRNGEIGQLIYTIRDYLLEIRDLLEKLQYEELPKQEMTFEEVAKHDTPFEDTAAPKVENSELSTEKRENERKFYKGEIHKMIDYIDNVEWLIKLYVFIKGFYDDVEGRAIK